MQVIEVIRHPQDKAESKYNPDAGISKEDEERYQKLLCENEELQRLIVQVSIRAPFTIQSVTYSRLIGPFILRLCFPLFRSNTYRKKIKFECYGNE